LEKWYIHFPFLQETEGNPGLGLSLLKMMRKLKTEPATERERLVLSWQPKYRGLKRPVI
jgi:hypothetical protein